MNYAVDLSRDRRMRLYLLLIIAFGVCLRLVYFSEDIGGSHTFRQAMVANQIDTLKSKPYPGPKLGFLERYDQTYDYGVVLYDAPIYQFIAAKVSDFFDINAIRAARLVNLLIYIGISLIFYEILLGIGVGAVASLLTSLLLAVSPLSIQNTIGIYPDILATLAGYLSFYFLMRYERKRSWRHFSAALVFGSACTMIKMSIYILFAVAYAWTLAWTLRWRMIRRIDMIIFALVIAASVAAFVLERSYFNFVLVPQPANYNEYQLTWYLGPISERLELEPWGMIGKRFAFEYLHPVLMPLALLGLWRVIRQFFRKRTDPQLTLLGLTVGASVSILVFFNVFFRHDYYAQPLLPIYCVLTSIGMLYLYSLIGIPFASNRRAYTGLAFAAIFGSLYYAYSLRLLNYNENTASLAVGKSVQELVPVNGYLLYLQVGDSIDPEFLYYTRRRGVLSTIDDVDNSFVAQIIRDHRWNPDETYVLANAVRLKPSRQEKLKERLDKYDLREIGNASDNSIVYKLIPRS